MPSIGHLACGLALGRARATTSSEVPGALLLYSALSYLPDADAISFKLGIPYSAPFGHRGALHSFTFAAVVGVIAAGVAALRGRSAWKVGLLAFAALATHDVLDAMTDGGMGIALFWPVTNHRYFLPWQPIPVAPIGLGILSDYGWRVARAELAMFAPIFLWGLWPRRRRAAARAEAEPADLGDAAP